MPNEVLEKFAEELRLLSKEDLEKRLLSRHVDEWTDDQLIVLYAEYHTRGLRLPQ